MLEQSWNNLLQELNASDELGKEIFTNLVATYSSATRKYHNLGHIRQVILTIEEVREIANSLPVILLSAWFHDYVYNPKKENNELQSANVAELILNKLKIEGSVIQTVKKIILSTQHHQPLLDSVDNLILLDADLSILGAPIAEYRHYAKAIRQEYQWMSDREYSRGRSTVLSSFLARDRIYYTDYFYRKLELSARNNLHAEIKMYSRSGR